jgi:hypothetical protein
MNNATLPQLVIDYLAGHNVMTLATYGKDGPWASAVFYACDGCSMYFLSSPNCRHSRNLAHDARCAATIQDDYRDWQQIKGIQLEGRVNILHGEAETRAKEIYSEKFPIIRASENTSPLILKALEKVRWFVLVPEHLFFVDNGKGFGHREEFWCVP